MKVLHTGRPGASEIRHVCYCVFGNVFGRRGPTFLNSDGITDNSNGNRNYDVHFMLWRITTKITLAEVYWRFGFFRISYARHRTADRRVDTMVLLTCGRFETNSLFSFHGFFFHIENVSNCTIWFDLSKIMFVVLVGIAQGPVNRLNIKTIIVVHSSKLI